MARLPGMLVDGRRAARTWVVVIAITAVVIAIPVVLARDALFGPGPTAVHDLSRLADRIHVCGRTYHGFTLTSRGSWPPDAPFVLVEPAPLAPCQPSVEDPAGVCTSGQVMCGTWTVVLVRVGEDAYAVFELLGGP